MNKKNYHRILLTSIAAISLTGLSAPSALATDYTIVPGAGPLNWNTDANWTLFSAGQYPGTAFGDTALVTGNFGGVAQTVNLSSTPAFDLIALTLGDTNTTPVATTISASPGASLLLSGALITSAGTAGAINVISAPINLASGNLTFEVASTNNLTLSGLITAIGTTRTITNNSAKIVTLGAIDLSTSSDVTTFTNANTAGTKTVLSDVISGGAGLSYTAAATSSGYEIDGVNTYGGTTALGAGTYTLGSDSPFSAGDVTTSGAVTFASINADRTISNAINIGANNLTFGVAATNNLTLSGKITATGAAHTITNSSNKTLTLGAIDLSTSTGITTIANTNTAGAKTVLGGVISGGTNTSATAMTFTGNVAASSGYEIDGFNTYSGGTQLGNNATYTIGSDSPFGTGALTTFNTQSQPIIFTTTGGDHVIANSSTVLRRTITFNGSNSLSFTNAVNPTQLQIWTNNITGTGKALIFNGGFATGGAGITGDLGRNLSIAGPGTTIFNGTITDIPASSTPMQFTYGIITNASTGVGTGSTFIIAGTASIQGDFRITGSGTIQMGNGGTTGVITPEVAFGEKSVVTGGNSATGFFAVNRSDAITLHTTINGPIGFNDIGAGAVTIDNPMFHTGSNTIGDGTTASKLVVTAGTVGVTTQSGTVGGQVPSITSGPNVIQKVTGLTSTAGLVVGQPVYLTTPNAGAYIHNIVSSSEVWLMGNTNIAAGAQTLNFGAGSSLGSGETTIKNNATLAGTATISGSVTGLAGSRLAPGVNTIDADLSGRGNFGVAGTLTVNGTAGLTLTDAHLDFDLASTAAGVSDRIVTNSNPLALNGAINFTFNGLTPGVLQTGTAYHLFDTGVSTPTGDPSLFTTTFAGGLAGYTATYSYFFDNIGIFNYVDVTFALVPEPTSLSLLALASVGVMATRRSRRQ